MDGSAGPGPRFEAAGQFTEASAESGLGGGVGNRRVDQGVYYLGQYGGIRMSRTVDAGDLVGEKSQRGDLLAPDGYGGGHDSAFLAAADGGQQIHDLWVVAGARDAVGGGQGVSDAEQPFVGAVAHVVMFDAAISLQNLGVLGWRQHLPGETEQDIVLFGDVLTQQLDVSGRGLGVTGGIACHYRFLHRADKRAAFDMLGEHDLNRAEAGLDRLQGGEENVLLLAVVAAIGELGQDLQRLVGVLGGDAPVAGRDGGQLVQDIEHLQDDPMLAGQDAGGANAGEIDWRDMIGTGHGNLGTGVADPYAFVVPLAVLCIDNGLHSYYS